MGTATLSGDARAQAMRDNILWGCPAFTAYLNGAYNGGSNPIQTGYGMNAFPLYTQSYPPVAAPPNTIGDTMAPNQICVVNSANNWATINQGTWYKLNQWTQPAERALVGDTRVWILECQAGPLNGQIPGQPKFTDQLFWGANGTTAYDFYRHGKYPGLSSDGITFKTQGGKVGYNVLFADGHVSTLISREDGYRAARLRFPG